MPQKGFKEIPGVIKWNSANQNFWNYVADHHLVTGLKASLVFMSDYDRELVIRELVAELVYPEFDIPWRGVPAQPLPE